MLALRFNGTRPANRVYSEMDRFFNEALQGFPALKSCSQGAPAVDIWQDADNVYLDAELPGLKLDDIELVIHGDELTISGERKCNGEEEISYFHRERPCGSFRRVVTLPDDVNAEAAEAALRDGVLRVTIPKSESSKPRKISVKSD